MREFYRRGFTLMELLTVMVIMVLMMSIAGVSFFTARQGAEMRGAVRAVQTTISLARQQAVVKRTRYNLTFSNATMNGIQSGCMILEAVRSVTNSDAHEIRYLPPKITFDSGTTLEFNPDGSAVSAGTGNIKINLTQDYQPQIKKSLQFSPLIGAMVVGED